MANAKLSVLLFWLIISIKTVVLTNNYNRITANYSLGEVILFLAREHLSTMTKTIAIAEHCLRPEISIKNNQLMEYVLQNLNEAVSVQLVVHEYSEQPQEYHIFIIDSVEAFLKLSFNYDNNFERHFRFLIVLSKYTRGFRKTMEDIFVLCFKNDVIDANIIIEHPRRGVTMYTYFHYSEEVCRGFLPKIIYQFSDGFDNLKNIFPEKVDNFHKCPFKVSSRNLPPYIIFQGNESDPKRVGDWDNLSGIEGSLIKLLATALNFTIDLRPFPLERSQITGNQSFGCFYDIEVKNADIAVGCFIGSNPSSRYVFSPTSPHHNAPYYYIVKGRRNVDALSRLAQPFTAQVWLLVAIVFILSVVFILCLKSELLEFVFGEENRNPVTNFVAVFLGITVVGVPRRNFARFVLLQILLLTLVLRNAYQGSLYDAFRMDKFAWLPSGYDDLVKWNFTVLLPPETAELKLFPNQKIIKVENDGYEQRLQLLEQLDGNYATVAIQDAYSYYLEKHLRNGSNLFLVREAIYNYQFVMFLPKQSIYLKIINKKLKELRYAGITSKLSSSFTMDPMLLRKLMEKPKNIALSNNRLMALYDIFGGLLVVSMVVFGLEVLSVRCRRLQRFILRII